MREPPAWEGADLGQVGARVRWEFCSAAEVSAAAARVRRLRLAAQRYAAEVEGRSPP